MLEVAIIGAGEIGGMLAHLLVRRALAGSVRLIDEAGRAAEGQALDIAQAASIEGSATTIVGSTEPSDAAGAAICVIADRRSSGEWAGDDGLLLLKRLTRSTPGPFIVCAGAEQRELVERGVRELFIPRTQIIGSAPEGFAAAARAIVALELDASPRDVTLSVIGVPPDRIVIGWEDASVAGWAMTRVISEPVRRRLTERIGALWPPGPFALASAASKVIEAVAGHAQTVTICFVAPDDSSGTRRRTAALPVKFGPSGVDVVLPPLGVAEQVALDNALML
jgi:malate/lactate dehydrogenase